jgi:hypothetical protein
MIVAAAITSGSGNALWAMEFAPFVDAFRLLSIAIEATKPAWPPRFEHDVVHTARLAPGDVAAALHMRRLWEMRARGTPDAKIDAPKADVHALYTAAAADVLVFVFVLVTSVDDERVADDLNGDAARPVTSMRAPSMLELSDFTLAVARTTRCAVRGCDEEKDAALGTGDFRAEKVFDQLPAIAGRVQNMISASGDAARMKHRELSDK